MTDLQAAVLELCTELTACAHESQPPVAEAFAYAVEKLRELCAQYGWQPIESAPKDGTPILVITRDGDVLSVKHYANNCWQLTFDCAVYVDDPAGWMPLPKVPKC